MPASVAETRSLAVLDEPEARDRFEAAVERMEERKRWLPKEFSLWSGGLDLDVAPQHQGS